ncbi:uncharacterized protein LAJ45_02215 [Morchella importuna]|uniref:Osmotin, thaumatin-like protein n=1 Tax=Morchella conica CCBAS932 TaxID=1392247 RepID=A0A3N4KVF4_9PEZI|nr:uncharacterized protein LAJ45_02215 [Morchella importuna]KAH8153403.1 hypothetical protein LAJ45_02215 [Morchella importuna]RPB13232.1 Osmotin, thaumatin-like protein [Morchella conica CCBAS932]
MISPYLLFLLPALSLAQQQTRSDTRTLTVTNNCPYTIWPGLLTSNGTGPATTGFELAATSNRSVTVGWDWVGRIWGRTNCTFGADGAGYCLTGDCGNKLECQGAGQPPTTLAEFTISGSGEQSYFDVSLVDGYDLDMKITPQYQNGEGNSPSCVMTSPVDDKAITHWCPFDLLVFPPPKSPRDSAAFWYPDDNLERPLLSPCLSACAKWNKPEDCCKGKWDDPKKCKPSLYSSKAKAVCPDAYSYAYDDHLSTFTVPTGQGFEVTFCPAGESSDIMMERGVTSGAAGGWKGGMSAVLAVAGVVGMVNML